MRSNTLPPRLRPDCTHRRNQGLNMIKKVVNAIPWKNGPTITSLNTTFVTTYAVIGGSTTDPSSEDIVNPFCFCASRFSAFRKVDSNPRFGILVPLNDMTVSVQAYLYMSGWLTSTILFQHP